MLISRRVLALLPLMLFLFFAGTIDLNNLFNYANQGVPAYIDQDNTTDNPISDAGATLGRVLFYDKNLSANFTVSCASCHQQAFAFGDSAVQSIGLEGGLTGRHSMRLVNARFAEEAKFFWDERAETLEDQVTRPIQDHVEMGFSGTEGDLNFGDLIQRLTNITYYQNLFTFVYGDPAVTEERIQLALAQFVRSIQSFDARYDEGYAQVNNPLQPFPNFTNLENQGKALFTQPRNLGGAGCQGCHRAPEFDIDPNSLNNGVIDVAGDAGQIDLTNTRAPSLRDLVNPAGETNGPFMHSGSLTTLLDVINHYDNVSLNPNLDNRLRGGPGGNGQQLNLTENEKLALVAFLETLSGEAIYVDERWSDPFSPNGEITILSGPVATNEVASVPIDFELYPNPATDLVTVRLAGEHLVFLYDQSGRLLHQQWFRGQTILDVSTLTPGMYLLRCVDDTNRATSTQKLIVR